MPYHEWQKVPEWSYDLIIMITTKRNNMLYFNFYEHKKQRGGVKLSFAKLNVNFTYKWWSCISPPCSLEISSEYNWLNIKHKSSATQMYVFQLFSLFWNRPWGCADKDLSLSPSLTLKHLNYIIAGGDICPFELRTSLTQCTHPWKLDI